MTFAQRLKKAMADQEITQTGLSALTGIGKSGISQYLAGKNKPGKKAMNALAEALKVPVDWLNGEREEEKIIPTERNKLSVQEAAELMGVTQQFIRVGLQRGILPFGYAVQQTGSRYTYYISPTKFSAHTGIQLNPSPEGGESQ